MIENGINRRTFENIEVSSDDGLHWDSVEHSTDAKVRVGLSDSDVTTFTPGGAPGVSHDEVVEAGGGVGAPANRLNCVVHFGCASCIIVDSGDIGAESIANMKRDGSGSIYECLLESSGRSGGSDCTSDLDNNLGIIVVALSIIGNIWVGFVEFKTIVSNVGIAISKEATVASGVSVSP